MGYNSISGYSTTRLTGLSSGLDTDSLIKAAMTASQSKLDKMYQNKTKLEWKRDAYTTVRTKVSDFSTKFMSVLSPDNIFSKSAYKQYKVSMASDKYDSYFSIKGTSSAQAGSHKITSATMATTATLSGTKYRNRVAGITGAQYTNTKAGTATSRVLYDKEGVKITSIDSTTKLSELYTDSTNSSDKKAFGNGVSITVAGKGITLGENATLSDLQTELKSAGIDMTVNTNGQLVFSGKHTGVDSIQFKDGSTSDMVQAFGKGGSLGISELKSESLIKNTSMTLSALVEARNGNPALKSDGKTPVDMSGLSGEFTFKINGQTFNVTSDTIQVNDKPIESDGSVTVQDIIDAVNGSDAKVKMTFENGQFSLRSTETGSGSTIKTENISGSFFGGAESLTGIAADETSGYQSIDRSKDTLLSAAAKMGLNFTNGKDTISFKINGQEFTFKKDITLDKMMSEINSNTDAKVKMTYSQISDSFEITSLETGHAATVDFESTDTDAMKLLGFYSKNAEGYYLDGSDEKLVDAEGNAVTDKNLAAYMDQLQAKGGSLSARGTDAMLEIDGEQIVRSSNKFVIDGMEITIKDNFVADDFSTEADKPTVPGLGAASFSVSQDVDSVVDKVKAFVTAYNELVDSLYGLTTEAKDYDYDALTEDQRDNMEKEDIEKWEAEAKKGILRNDTTIRSFLSKMRNAIFEKIGGTSFNDITGSTADKGLSAYDIGFNTTKYAAGEYGGKLTFDEDKFRAALERDPEAVANVMAQVSESSDAATEYKESGFVTKLYDMMSDFTNTMRGKNIANVNKQITDANKAMQTQIQKMYEEQERYYKQYAALESLMTSYQNQAQWMAQQFASLTSTN